MHIVIFGLPLSLALVIWLINIAASIRAARTVTVIKRTITASDGSQATFIVPTDEPYATSIARMHPFGVEARLGVSHVNAPQFIEGKGLLVEQKGLWARLDGLTYEQTIWFSIVALIVATLVLTAVFKVGYESGNSSTSAYISRSTSAYGVPVITPAASRSVPSSIEIITNSSTLENSSPAAPKPTFPVKLPTHIRLKTGANIREAPSKTAPILRVGHQGDFFTQFSTANGWVQIGTEQPEGWVAGSVVTSTVP